MEEDTKIFLVMLGFGLALIAAMVWAMPQGQL